MSAGQTGKRQSGKAAFPPEGRIPGGADVDQLVLELLEAAEHSLPSKHTRLNEANCDNRGAPLAPQRLNLRKYLRHVWKTERGNFHLSKISDRIFTIPLKVVRKHVCVTG